MNQSTVEEIVRATIQQLTKQPEPQQDNFREWFRDRMEKKKMKQYLKKGK